MRGKPAKPVAKPVTPKARKVRRRRVKPTEVSYTTLDGSVRKGLVTAVRLAAGKLVVRFAKAKATWRIPAGGNIIALSTGKRTYRADGLKWASERGYVDPDLVMALVSLGVIAVFAFVGVVAWRGEYVTSQTCLQQGYSSHRYALFGEDYCVARRDQTDVVVPYRTALLKRAEETGK